MKKAILLGLVLFSTLLSFAQGNRNKSEVFVQINDRGKYIVNLDDESVISRTGRFRFYDVYSSAPVLSISQGDRVIFSKRINVRPDERIVLDFNNGQLRLLKQLNIFNNQRYALDDFWGYSNNGGDKNIPEIQPNYNNYKLLSPEAINNLYDLYKKESFDDGRTRLIKATVKNALFSSEQVNVLLKNYAFDDERLNMAKYLYKFVVDPQNYTIVANTFKFVFNKREFLDFLAKE